MRRFTFQLEPVLRQRREAERSKQMAVAALERQRLAAEDRIQGIRRAIEAGRNDLRTLLGPQEGGDGRTDGVSLADVRMEAAASLRLVSMGQQAVLELAGVCRQIDRARLELLRATTARKTVEVLKSRRYERWRKEEARREQAETDDLNSTRSAREPQR